MAPRPLITFLSDFGSREPYVAAVKGVILQTCPEARILDISHEVHSHDLLEAAFVLSCSFSYFPAGTIHLVVVDPGVGTERRGIIASGGQHLFVAPDNGVLSLIFDKAGVSQAHSIEAEHYYRHPVSATFHGRDIFGPVAGQLARGIDPAMFGPEIQDYARLNLPPVQKAGERQLEGFVLHIDKFGNVITSLTPEDLQRAFGEQAAPSRFLINGKEVQRHCRFYGEAAKGELISLLGSSGYYELAASQKPAAALLEARRGQKVAVEV